MLVAVLLLYEYVPSKRASVLEREQSGDSLLLEKAKWDVIVVCLEMALLTKLLRIVP